MKGVIGETFVSTKFPGGKTNEILPEIMVAINWIEDVHRELIILMTFVILRSSLVEEQSLCSLYYRKLATCPVT